MKHSEHRSFFQTKHGEATGKSFALTQNSELCGFLLKLMGFAYENSENVIAS